MSTLEEIKLVHEVKNCDTCAWFWGGIPPYGPYPAFDWKKTCPKAILDHPPQTEDTLPIRWTTAEGVGQKLVEPAVLRGCRKAPIMTIGINPNLTAYFPSQQGATWAYPWFEQDANYAYYYRHASVYQESLDLEDIQTHLIPETELIGESDGWLIHVERGSDHRWLQLTVKYRDREKPVTHEMAWTPEARAVVLVNSTRPDDIPNTDPTIKEGIPFAGKLAPPQGQPVQINANGTGYYQRFIPVLEKFKARIGGPLADAPLAMGEDVCMQDMVACASPGWSSAYDIPRKAIQANCVNKHDFAMRQLLQSNPGVVVLVSTSSLSMFAESFIEAGGDFGLDYRDRDIYDLLEETSQRRCYMTYEKDGQSLRARILATPHFSYGENFRTQSRFSEAAWQAFQKEYPANAKTLSEENRVYDTTWNGYVPIKLSGPEDDIKEKVGVAAWRLLMAHFYDPYELLAQALEDEYNHGNLGYDPDRRHLIRTEGNCKFCVNSEWQFPEGCEYGKC